MIPKQIILHHSLTKDGTTVSWGAIRRYHIYTNKWENIAYHFGLELIGDYYEILLGRMMYEMGAHTYGQNRDSLGICFVGNYDLSEVPPEMWKRGIDLVSTLCRIFDIDTDNIHGHNEYAPKSCPGKNFNVQGFKAQVEEAKHL